MQVWVRRLASLKAIRAAEGRVVTVGLTSHPSAKSSSTRASITVVVGVIAWELHLDGCTSLKQKRAILRSLKDRLRGRHNVSVAETDHQDTWQRAEISVALVSSDRRQAQSMLSRVDSFVASDPRVRIIDSTTILY